MIIKRKAHHYPVKLMGCGFVLTAIHNDPQIAWDGIRAGVAEIERIECLISSWRMTSETSKINQAAGVKPIKVSKELFGLIERSRQMSELTAGSFDISGTLARYYWTFDKEERAPISLEKIKELRELIDYRQIKLDPIRGTVFLQKKGMKIGFGGIGKGYAALRTQQVMQNNGIESGLINAAGDLMSWGQPLNKTQWDINIPDPKDRNRSLLSFSMPAGSVVTSGNYENYTFWEGKRYSHIIDPRTGCPVETIKQVTVVCPQPEFADALATAVSVLGVEEGLNIVNRLNGVECVIIDSMDEISYSKGLQNLFLQRY